MDSVFGCRGFDGKSERDGGRPSRLHHLGVARQLHLVWSVASLVLPGRLRIHRHLSPVSAGRTGSLQLSSGCVERCVLPKRAGRSCSGDKHVCPGAVLGRASCEAQKRRASRPRAPVSFTPQVNTCPESPSATECMPPAQQKATIILTHKRAKKKESWRPAALQRAVQGWCRSL